METCTNWFKTEWCLLRAQHWQTGFCHVLHWMERGDIFAGFCWRTWCKESGSVAGNPKDSQWKDLAKPWTQSVLNDYHCEQFRFIFVFCFFWFFETRSSLWFLLPAHPGAGIRQWLRTRLILVGFKSCVSVWSQSTAFENWFSCVRGFWVVRHPLTTRHTQILRPSVEPSSHFCWTSFTWVWVY